MCGYGARDMTRWVGSVTGALKSCRVIALAATAAAAVGCSGPGDDVDMDEDEASAHAEEAFTASDTAIRVVAWNKYFDNAFDSGGRDTANFKALLAEKPDVVLLQEAYDDPNRAGSQDFAALGRHFATVRRGDIEAFHKNAQGNFDGTYEITSKAKLVIAAKAGITLGPAHAIQLHGHKIGIYVDGVSGKNHFRVISTHIGVDLIRGYCHDEAPCETAFKVEAIAHLGHTCAQSVRCVMGGDFNDSGADERLERYDAATTEVVSEDIVRDGQHRSAEHLFMRGAFSKKGGRHHTRRTGTAQSPFNGSDHQMLVGILGWTS